MKITKEILEEAKNWYLEGNSIRKVANLIQEKYGIKVGKEAVRICLSKVIKLRNKKEVMAMKRGTFLFQQENYQQKKLLCLGNFS